MPDEQNGTANSGGGAQRLWWRDELANEAAGAWRATPQVGAGEQGTVAAQQIAAPVLVHEDTTTEADTWAELEAEAARRAEAALRAESENVVIYANKAQNLARLRKRLLLILGPIIALFTIFACVLSLLTKGAVPFPVLLIPVFIFLAEGALLYAIMKRVIARRNKPIVTLSPEGIEVHGPSYDLGLVHWDEIKEVRAFTMLYRYVGIVPKDTKALCKRLGPKRSHMIRLNHASNRLTPKVATPVINIAQEYLPLTADELVKRIEEYRAGLTNAGD